MVGIIIATHGKMAVGLKDAVELIMGPQENIETLSLTHGMDIEEYGEKISQSITRSDKGKGVLVLVDLFGASPYNQSVMKKAVIKDTEFRIISGVNLPMLLEATAMSGASSSVNELWESVLNVGIEGIKDFDSEFEKIA